MSDQPQQLYRSVSRGRSSTRRMSPITPSKSVSKKRKTSRSRSATPRAMSISRSRSRSKSKGGKTKASHVNLETAAASLQHPAMYNHAKHGFVQNWQHGFIQDDGVSASIVGHYSTPTYRVRLGLFAAMAKKAFDYFGWRIRNWAEHINDTNAIPITGAATLPDQNNPANWTWPDTKEFYAISIYWRYGAGAVGQSAENPGAFKYLFIPYQGESFMGYAYKIMNCFYTQINTDRAALSQPKIAEPPQLVMMRAWKRSPISDAGGATSVSRDFDLQDAVVEIDAHSVLKCQNRTKTTSTDQAADDIDLVPLVGKAYTGKGPGMYLAMGRRGAAESPLNLSQYPGYVGSCANGYISVGFAAASANYDTEDNPESYPQPKRALKRVSDLKNVGMTPGEISDSVLSYSKKFKLNHLLRLLGDYTAYQYDSASETNPVETTGTTLGKAVVKLPNDGTASIDSFVGNFRAFWVQKQLNLPTAVGELSNIALYCEIDTRLGVSVTFKRQKIPTIFSWKSTLANT